MLSWKEYSIYSVYSVYCTVHDISTRCFVATCIVNRNVCAEKVCITISLILSLMQHCIDQTAASYPPDKALFSGLFCTVASCCSFYYNSVNVHIIYVLCNAPYTPPFEIPRLGGVPYAM